MYHSKLVAACQLGLGEAARNAVFASLPLKSPSYWEENIVNKCLLFTSRMVLTFATRHTFCTSRDGPRKSGFVTMVPAKTELFLCSL